MKPAPFDYRCPDTLDEALALLARHKGAAKIIAGGQSLMPMINFRIVRPALLVDVKRLLEYDFVRPTAGGGLAVGALTRHRVLETSPLVAARFPVIAQAMRHVAHVAIRNRGTIGGSLSHADPAAELPMLSLLLDAQIHVRAAIGSRIIPASTFFLGALSNALHDDEIVVQVDLPGLAAGIGWAFEEFSRRAGDFALAALGVLVRVTQGRISEARIALMGVADTPVRAPAAEALLLGAVASDALIEQAVRAACEPLQPPADLHASPEYRRHLAAVLAHRAISAALRRATGYAQLATANER